MSIKKIVIIFTLFGLGFLTVFNVSAKAGNDKKIYLFYGTGCPHCGQVDEFFTSEDLYSRYPVERKEIYFNRENALLFNALMEKLNVPNNRRGVPAVVIGDKVLIGDTPIINGFIEFADEYLSETEYSDTPAEDVNNGKSSITLAAVIAGSLVDAINPCAFAVLIILMTTVLAIGDSKKGLYSGLAFSISIFISYFLMGLGLYKAISIGGVSGTLFKAVGWVAIILGLFNLKDFFWYGKGFLMEVPMAWRPNLKKVIHSVTSPKGAFFVGFLVSLFLLPCTSGPYIIILGMLAKNAFDAQAILYLFIYNLIFVSPMVLITLAVYRGFDPNKAEEIRQKRLRALHLVAGIVMLAMGIVILKGWV